MREGIGHHIALASSLQPVVADRCRRLQGRLDIARLDDAPLFCGVVTPHACKTVGLQFNANLQLVALGLVQAALRLLHLR